MAESRIRHKKKKNKTVNKKKAGREFEEMIGRIETIAGQENAIVVSPDKLTDIDTGRLREVDASIRIKGGTSDILIIIECRDRSRSQDVRWIEEVKGKQRSVGANLAIAVSSKGFSPEALEKARANGVEVRTTRNVDAETVKKWGTCTEYSFRYQPEDIRVVCDVQDEKVETYKLEFLQLNNVGLLDVENFVNNISGKTFMLRSMFEQILHSLRDRFKAYVQPDDLVTMALNYNDKPLMTLRLPSGDYNVVEIGIDFKFSEYSENEILAHKAVTYSNAINDLVNAAEFKVKVPESGDEKIFTIHQNQKSGTVTMSMWDSPKLQVPSLS